MFGVHTPYQSVKMFVTNFVFYAAALCTLQSMSSQKTSPRDLFFFDSCLWKIMGWEFHPGGLLLGLSLNFRFNYSRPSPAAKALSTPVPSLPYITVLTSPYN